MAISRVTGLSATLGLIITGMAGSAWAIALPDNSSCSTNSANGCLRIENTNASVNALGIVGKGKGVGVQGSATINTGYGVYGFATSGSNATGVFGQAGGTGTSGYGVIGFGFSNAGVYGSAPSAEGVLGITTDAGKAGVKGLNQGSSGYGVIGTVSPGGTGTAIYGDAGNSGTSWAGYFVGDISAVGYFNNSDARLKKDIADSHYGLTDLLKLRPVTYKWKAGADNDGQLGLIAQEVQAVIPEVVRADAKSGMLSVNYNALLPLAVKAIQQQELRIASLEAALAKKSAVSSLSAGKLGVVGLLVGLLPVGLIAVRRRRRK